MLALDFDGVISDSAVESFLVALRTFTHIYPDSRFSKDLDTLAGVDGGGIRSLSLYRDFLQLMPLGNRAEDFAVALKALEDGSPVDEQVAFDRVRDRMGSQSLADFHHSFYRERERLREENIEAWLSLLTPYEEFIALLKRRAGEQILALATAKDRATVDVLLCAYGIEQLFARDCIVDKEQGRSKRAHLRTLSERLGIPFRQITFVDDKLNHLEDVSGLGARCVLAGWGYNGERERRGALERGFVVSDLVSAEADLFGNSEGT